MNEWYNQCFLLSVNYNETTVKKETSSLFEKGLDASGDYAISVDSCFLYNAFVSYSYEGGLVTDFSSQQWNEWYNTISIAPAPVQITIDEITKIIAIISTTKSNAVHLAIQDYYNLTKNADENLSNYFRNQANLFNSSCCVDSLASRVKGSKYCNQENEISFSCNDLLKKIIKGNTGNLKENKSKKCANCSFIPIPKERNPKLPASILKTIAGGFDTTTTGCKNDIIEYNYSNDTYYSIQNNVTYSIPNEIVASQESKNTFTFPLLVITTVQEYLDFSIAISLEIESIFGVVIDSLFSIFVLEEPPYISWGGNASASGAMKNKLEVEGKVIAMVANGFTVIGMYVIDFIKYCLLTYLKMFMLNHIMHYKLRIQQNLLKI